MLKENVILFVCADETTNKGEAEYMKAVAAAIAMRGRRRDTFYAICKCPPAAQAKDRESLAYFLDDPFAYKDFDVQRTARESLPLTDAEYAAVPVLNIRGLEDFEKAKNLRIVGMGHSTRATVDFLGAVFRAVGEEAATMPAVSAAYITHLVDGADALRTVVEGDMDLFLKGSRKRLARLDPALAARAKVTEMEAVPHSAGDFMAQSLEHHKNYLKTERGLKVARMIATGAPFAFAVVNAGFDTNPEKIHTPYTAAEARRHGEALGRHLAPGTHLVLAHGGPRNLKDESMGEFTMHAFRQGYLYAQGMGAFLATNMPFGLQPDSPEALRAPKIFSERFEKNMPYNILYAANTFCQAENCVAVVPSSEGYGTMDQMLQCLSNRSRLLGMFSFGANEADTTGFRMDNVDDYHRAGIALLEAGADGKLAVNRHPEEKTTPYLFRNAALQVVDGLELAKPPENAQKRRPAPRSAR